MTTGIYKRTPTHGHSSPPTRIYRTWDAMRQRCLNPNDPSYPRYGGRGITIDPRWESFENFLEDMGERPEGMQIDRIDNDGNYDLGNCRWATASEQASNRRPGYQRGRVFSAEHKAKLSVAALRRWAV